jgi:DNA (cytosine-5)-methyltransferase 1
MKYLSLFSGIEAATVAWHPIGWECVGVSEIEPFPCAVLAHHYPEVPNLGDVTKITEDDIKDLGHIDIVVFGSPCQDLSVAGLRKGFTCESTDTLTRSGLFFIAMRIVEWAKKHCGCRFALWENVPGAFSSSGGRDFATVVEHMAGLENVPVPPKGWGNEGVAAGSEGLVEWATLDAQWFGVAQRRRRVFALADFGDWSNRQPILLEPESLRGDSAPSRETGEDASTTASSSIDVSCTETLTAGFGKVGAPEIDAYTAIPVLNWPASVAGTLDCSFGPKQGLDDQHINQGASWFVPVTHSLRGEGFDASEDGTGRGTPLVPIAFNPTQDPISSTYVCHSIGANNNATAAVAVPLRGREGGATEELGDEVGNCLRASGGGGDKAHVLAPIAYTTKLHNTKSNNAGKIFEERTTSLDANSPPPALLTAMQVRRLTPVECERLQGFPDGYTNIPWRKQPTSPDGPRYKALGNSMAVPVMAWIGRKIEEVIK